MRKLLMKNPHKVLPQLLAASIASLGFFCVGTVRGWSSPGIPSLRESRNFTMTDSDITWIASMTPLCALFGALAISIPMQLYGRRKALMGLCIPFIIGFQLMGFTYFGNHKAMLFVGRIMTGIMNGAATPASQIYVSECASPRVRGVLGSLTASSLALGILVAYIIGAFVPWHVLAWILGCFPLILFVGMFFMPETPIWLMAHNRESEARQALQRLRGKRTNIEAELQRIKDNVAKTANAEKIQPKDLISPTLLKPLGISMGLMFFQQFTGINAMVFYTVSIFKSAGSTIDKNHATIIVGFVQLICTAASGSLVDKFGRRILLLGSGAVVSISLAAMGIFFYFQSIWGEKEASASLGWLPLVSLIVFFIAFSGGFASVPFIVMGELFPGRFRNILGSISSSFNLLSAFTVVRSFPDMQVGMTKYGTFWFYMCCTLASMVFVFFLLPETKGKTLEDIEKLFGGKTTSANVQTLENGKTTNGTSQMSDVAAPNAYVNQAYHPGITALHLSPIDSEDEEEDDGVPVPTPM